MMLNRSPGAAGTERSSAPSPPVNDNENDGDDEGAEEDVATSGGGASPQIARAQNSANPHSAAAALRNAGAFPFTYLISPFSLK